MRMQLRRFTRLTNAFSKKAENHAHAVALHFMHYNFVQVHQTLRSTPAMVAGVTQPAVGNQRPGGASGENDNLDPLPEQRRARGDQSRSDRIPARPCGSF